MLLVIVDREEEASMDEADPRRALTAFMRHH
jgi:hypothetical protein